VAMTCEDVSEADARRTLLPSSPVMTIAGVVSHRRDGASRAFHSHDLSTSTTCDAPTDSLPPRPSGYPS
jgi:hypothetical protein